MKLETADEFSGRSVMVMQELKTLKAAMTAGVLCSKCRARATHRVGDSYFCALDARVERNRQRRKKFGSR